MTVVSLTTELAAPADRVWEEVNRPRLLRYVAHPILRFSPVDPPAFPEVWELKDYLVRLHWRGVLPLGTQVVSVSHPEPKAGCRFVRDNGHSALIAQWDHLIAIEEIPQGTRYTDRIDVDAGLRTPLVAAFARRFYAHRQRRWHALIASGFDYGSG